MRKTQTRRCKRNGTAFRCVFTTFLRLDTAFRLCVSLPFRALSQCLSLRQDEMQEMVAAPVRGRRASISLDEVEEDDC